MQVYHEDPPPTTISQAIDRLKGSRAQCCAAAVQILLTTFDSKEHRLTMEPTRLTIRQIAGTAGYPAAAVWRSLPLMEQAGLLRWCRLDDKAVEVTWIMPYEEIVQ